MFISLYGLDLFFFVGSLLCVSDAFCFPDSGNCPFQIFGISMKLVKDTDLMGIWTTLDDSQKPDFIKVFMESL